MHLFVFNKFFESMYVMNLKNILSLDGVLCSTVISNDIITIICNAYSA